MLVAEVRIEGLSGETERQLASNQIRTARGRPFDPVTVEQDLRRLGRLGRFGQTSVSARPIDADAIIVVFTFEPAPIIQDVEIVGNNKVSSRDIRLEVDLLAGTPVDSHQLDRTARRIERLYREKGFYRARVTIDQLYLDETGIVLFRIDEGDRVRVTAIRIEGHEAFTTAQLRSELQTKTASLFEKGPVDLGVLDQDVATLIEFYEDRGYLDVQADKAPIRFSSNGREAIITFLIDEGPRYTLRSVKAVASGSSLLDGDPGQRAPVVFSPEQLAGLMSIKRGDIYSVRAVRDSVDAIRDAYGRLGYNFDRSDPTGTRVEKRELRAVDAPEVDLLLIIQEGTPKTTGLVTTTNNTITKDSVILQQVDVKPGRPLDQIALERTERRLREINLFDPRSIRLSLQPAESGRPSDRDLLIEVEETNTGAISFGVTGSSDGGANAFISLEQRNFDITDLPDSFGELLSGKSLRGGGQTLFLQASPGTEIQSYSASLTEPYLLGSNFSGDISGAFRQREFSQFDEDRITGRLGFGRRLGSRWFLRSSVRWEHVDLHEIDEDALTDVFDVAGGDVITGVGFSLTRTTRDSAVRPTRGARTVLGVEQIGALGGDFTFTKLNASHSVLFPLHEDFYGRATTLELRARASYIPQDLGDVPIYERYFMGGRSMRGFAFRTVSPKGIRNDNGLRSDESTGGNWSFFLGTELTQPLVEDVIAGALFIDSGTVTEDPGFEDYRVSVGFGVRLYIPALGQAPLAFDFGFPLIKHFGDEERVFSFSFDVPLN